MRLKLAPDTRPTFMEDAKTITIAFERAGWKLSIGDAHSAWATYSSDLCAGWLGLDDDVVETLLSGAYVVPTKEDPRSLELPVPAPRDPQEYVDLERMQKVLRQSSYEVTDTDVSGAWSSYSEWFGTPWKHLPPDDELLEILLGQLVAESG
jgi:hypothetical protein